MSFLNETFIKTVVAAALGTMLASYASKKLNIGA